MRDQSQICCRLVTIHNNPDELKLPSDFKHLKIECPDVPTADISRHFNAVYEFIEGTRDRGVGELSVVDFVWYFWPLAVLVHCGAGVSRSATLCIAYLMRYHGWGVTKAEKYVLEKRKKIAVNDGFRSLLIQLQSALGIDEPMLVCFQNYSL